MYWFLKTGKLQQISCYYKVLPLTKVKPLITPLKGFTFSQGEAFFRPKLLYLCTLKINSMENENIAEEPMIPYNQPLDFQQVWRMFQETDKQFKETDKKFQETDKQFKETDRKIRELDRLFTSQWGKLVESLVEGDLINLLNTKGIKVHRTTQRAKGNYEGQNYEFDIIAYNGDEIVIVEVKTTLRPEDVNDFHEKMWKVKIYLPEYANKTVYGAIAFITADGSSERMAEKQGFFVIRATGNSSFIINKEDFKPKPF